MNLYEYQAKKLFTIYGLPVLKSTICSNLSEIEHCITNIAGPWVVKCQIHSGGRGKSGGVCITNEAKEVFSFAKKWLGKNLVTYQTTATGECVHHILIEQAIKILKEFYLSVIIDRDTSQIICIASAQGGMDIEIVSKNMPDLIHKVNVDPIAGAYPYQGRMLASRLGLSGKKINQFSK